MLDLQQAYLDDYRLISIEVDKKFHQGKADGFYLSLQDKKIDLEIVNTIDKNDKLIYQTTFNQDLEIGKEYVVYGQDYYPCYLQYRYIVKTERFNQEYYYDKADLGSTVYQGKTYFKLWAPSAKEVFLKLDNQVYPMVKTVNGVYQIIINQNLVNQQYSYLVFVNGQVNETIDPYGKAINYDNSKSIVIKENKGKKYQTTKLTRLSDAIIYESNIANYQDGNFVSYLDNIAHLKDLGINVLQLMPVNCYGGVDNYNNDSYNWGYNPIAYQSLHPSYGIKDISQEFTDLVNILHQNDIKIVLDVVFNHVYNATTSSFNKCVPFYYFRYDENNNYCEGSYCGNEFASEMAMARKYIIDTCKYYVNKYDVDGFRFDLMGLLDYQTINQIEEQLSTIKDDILLYGEGWKMNCGINEQNCANYYNQNLNKRIAFFNDEFRDVIKGNSFVNSKGYATGDFFQVEKAMSVLQSLRFIDANRSINYCQCHDNLTVYDQIVNQGCTDEKTIINQAKMILAFVLLSNGVSFIADGQQYCNSRQGIDNPYNNKQANIIIEEEKYREVFKFTKQLIAIKKQYHINSESVISINQIDCVIVYQVNNLTIIFNPLDKDYYYNLNGQYKDLLNDSKAVCGPYLIKEKEIAILEND